jgi:O-antigen/teichoic acid export membrane protein
MVASAHALVPTYGASGAAAAWALLMVIQNGLLYLYARAKLHLSPWSRAMVQPVVASALMSCLPPLAVAVVGGDHLWSLVVASVVSCAGLAGSMWTARGPVPAETQA